MEKLFNSPTHGELPFPQVVEKIIEYFEEEPESDYRVIIGSDSQLKNSKGYDFVSAIVVHRVGSGGIYFWQRIVKNRKFFLRERIYEEALMSLELARRVVTSFPEEDLHELEIHVDIGRVGETREMIAEVVGMVRGQGFEVKTKPEAYGAACVADRYT